MRDMRLVALVALLAGLSACRGQAQEEFSSGVWIYDAGPNTVSDRFLALEKTEERFLVLDVNIARPERTQLYVAEYRDGKLYFQSKHGTQFVVEKTDDGQLLVKSLRSTESPGNYFRSIESADLVSVKPN